MKFGVQISYCTSAENARIWLQYAERRVNLLAICHACISTGTALNLWVKCFLSGTERGTMSYQHTENCLCLSSGILCCVRPQSTM